MTGVMPSLPPPSTASGGLYALCVARRWRLLPNDPDMGWVPYVWVLYLAFVFLTPVIGEYGGASMWAGSVAAAVVFLPLYVAGYWYDGWRQLAVALGIAAIGVWLAPINAGASVFFIYAAYFGGMAFRQPLRGLAVVAGLLLVVAATTYLRAPNVYFAGPAGLGVLVLGLLGSHYARRHAEMGELRMARAEIETLARIAERDRIAGDLHDLLGQTLSLIVLKSELTAALVRRDPARAETEAEEVQRIAREALTEVRMAVRGYRVGSGAGLQRQLDRAAEVLEVAGVGLEIEGGPDLLAARLDAAREGVLALAIREAATNIVRHARARRCKIIFFDDEPEHGVEIVDDGRGLVGGSGHGLRGMRERVEAQAGAMTLEGGPDGTRLRVAFSPRVEGQGETEAAA